MNYNYFSCLLLLLSVCCLTVRAQEAWSLRRCIDYAIEHNINIRQTDNTAQQSAI